MNEKVHQLLWAPQPGPQHAFVRCPCPEVFFGGARGGGKTDGVLGKWLIKEALYGRHFNALMLRRTTVSAEDAIERSKELYGPCGGHYNETLRRWRMPHGGRVTFGYLETIQDANEYQGRNVTDCWVEEAGQYPDPLPIDRLFGILRSAHGVPVQLVLTANPGGAGQHWLAARYGLIPFPEGPRLLKRKMDNGNEHSVAIVPSRIQDNKILMERDPQYVQRLRLVGSPQLVKAWLEGDWTAIEGAFFEVWSELRHILKPFTVPVEWLRFRSADWGSYSPFSFGWWTVVQDDYRTNGTTLPRGALVRYREWYGQGGGKGKLTAEEVAKGIIERERDDPRLAYGVLDPSTFNSDGGPSIAERINRDLGKAHLPMFRPADNQRVSTKDGRDRRGPMGGWDQMRQRMIGVEGTPMIYCFDTCKDSIRTIPVLQHDPRRAEDLDTQQEDHAADEWRYACMSRPWLKRIVKEDVVKPAYVPFDEQVNDSFLTL